MRRSRLTIALLAGLAGCSLIPDYHRPALPVSEQWQRGPAAEEAARAVPGGGAPASALGWRDFFTDPVVQDLIALTLQNNRDLRVATDSRRVMKSLLRDHLGLDTATLDRKVFPETAGLRPVDGLVRV